MYVAGRRAAKNISLRELARRSNVAPNTVRNIEAGETQAGTNTLYRIVAALEIDDPEFFDLAGLDMKDRLNVAKQGLDMTGLRPEQLKLVQAYIDGLRDASN